MGALLSPGGLIMRKKLIRLTLVLAVLATASLSSSVFADEDCDTPEIHCCADGRCVTCCEPCAIRCTV
jgi:hypothetical protein